MKTFWLLYFTVLSFANVWAQTNPFDYPDTLWLYGTSTNKSYGVTPQNPIKVGGGTFPKNNYTYLKNLTDEKGNPVTFKRIGSCCSEIIGRSKPLTSFTVTANGKEITLYFDQYEWDKPMLVKALGWKENRLGYQGEFVEDSLFQGHGIYFFEDGGYYRGQWNRGNMEGTGTMHVPGTETYTGEFKNNQYEGTGTLLYADGGRYEGQFQNGKRHGQGILFYPPKSEIVRIEGRFENNKPVGEFKIMDKKGKITTQTF